MLRPSKPDQPPGLDPKQQQIRALQSDMLGADDTKIRRIVGMLEGSQDHQLLQAVLDPLRPRLASLRPIRVLRFTRLLFIPVTDLLVPTRDWKPGRAAIPRSILNSISDTVSVALGPKRDEIEQLIAGHDTSEAEIVERAGALLWARAGAILATAPTPVNWEDAGLALTAYAPLARGIATVLGRAAALQALQRDIEVGMLQPNDRVISEIVFGMAGEPAEGRALVFKLILGQFPHAARLLRRLSDFSQSFAERAVLRSAIDSGMDDVLTDLEVGAGLASGLRDGALSALGLQVQQIVSLLEDLGDDTAVSANGPRLTSIREQIDMICRGRFLDGLKKGLVEPLAAGSAPVDRAGQKELESCARDLRIVETAGRTLGNPAAYDALIAQAGKVVESATIAGNLNRVRGIRLVEIMVGPEAAERLYEATRKPDGPKPGGSAPPMPR